MSLAVVPATMHGDNLAFVVCDGQHRTPPIIHPGDSGSSTGGILAPARDFCPPCTAKRLAAEKRRVKS